MLPRWNALLWVWWLVACSQPAPHEDAAELQPTFGGPDAGPIARADAVPPSDAARDALPPSRVDGGAAGMDAANGTPIAPADWCVNGSSVLATTVRGMTPRSFRKLPPNAGLAALPMEASLLYWADSAVWDPSARRVHWVGGPGSCCTATPDYKRLSYDVATDQWSVASTPFSGNGHAYDGNALDPNSGDHFFALYGDRKVKRLHAGAWDELTATPWPVEVAVGIAWFPDLAAHGALVYVNGGGKLATYAQGVWTDVAGAANKPWGEYNLFAEYNPVQRVTWVGGGNGAEHVHYVLDASGVLHSKADAPISLSNGAAWKSVDPVSGHYVVLTSEQSFWDYDPAIDAWALVSTIADKPSLDGVVNGGLFHVAIPECGVILFFNHVGAARDVYAYRH